MKIGILTFHCAHNYGAVLQAFSLQSFFQLRGHETYIIDYRPDYLIKGYGVLRRSTSLKIKNLDMLKNIFVDFFSIYQSRKRYLKFNRFINERLNLTKIDFNQDLSKFDVIVLGSDQIWNPDITGKMLDPIYFGNFRAAIDSKIISYAASSGSYVFTEKELPILLKNLINIDSISVREIQLSSLITNKLGLENRVLLDPTLLIENKTLDYLTNDFSKQKPYIVLFRAEFHENSYKIANEIAQKYDYKIIEITYGDKRTSPLDNIINTCSPEELLSYIKYANCIISTSFHGAALSLSFNKLFYIVKTSPEIDLRSLNLLSILNLESRIISINDDCDLDSVIDYNMVNTKLESMRKFAEDWLVHSISR